MFQRGCLELSWGVAKFSCWRTDQLSRISEITIDPHGKLCGTKAVLDLEAQTGILASERSVHPHEDPGKQQKAEQNAGSDGNPDNLRSCSAPEGAALSADFGRARLNRSGILFLVHGKLLFSVETQRSSSYQGVRTVLRHQLD